MRILTYCACMLAISASMHASSLDGTSSVQWVTTTPSFSDTESARGFIKFTNGFSVDAGATVAFNVTESVAGNVNLNNTGIMHLEGDMHLASGSTLSNGGAITTENGATLFLDSNCTLPKNKTVTIQSDVVIDGQGHELVFTAGKPGAVLLIDGAENTTLTLRNMTLRGLRDYAGNIPAIKFGAAANQRLILENVTIWLSDDYTFDDGRMTIAGNVAIKGPYTMTYKAAYDLTIRKDATFLLDLDTVMRYMPTDKKNSHLVFSASTSRLMLNGCTIYAPSDCGLKLAKGHLVVDHLSTLHSDGEGNEFKFGTGIPGDDITIDYLPGAQLVCANGLFIYNNQN